MPTVSVDEAQGHLKDIIAGLNSGEELIIVQDGEPIAALARTAPRRWPSKAGSYRKAGFWMAPDFDEPVEDFPRSGAPL